MNQTETTIIHGETFDTILRAVDRVADIIRPTYGPAANKVIIQKMTHRMVVDDGVQIARDLELADPAENAVLNVIRETAVKTNDRVGDGTTSSIILLQAIMHEVKRRARHKDGRKVSIELKAAFAEAKASLMRSSKKISTKAELKQVARVSFDDEKMAEMIAEIYTKLGPSATVTVERSPTMETLYETAQGLTIPNGYLSPYMISNPERMETVLENPYILFTDYRITEAADIVPLMQLMAGKNHRELVIVCEHMEGSALATAIVNGPYMKKVDNFFIVVVPAPKNENRTVMMEDMAMMTGAHLFSQSKGDALEAATMEHLGRAKQFIARRNESIIVGPKGDKKEIAAAVESVKKAAANEKDERRQQEHLQRLGFLQNTLATIKVGAPTENEMKALKYKVEDAVNAVKSAYKTGVVCGAGISFARLKTSSEILNEALKYPARQLRENMGIEGELELGSEDVLNVVSGEKGTFMDVGVMDPVEVLIAGIESAVSIASILVTSHGIIVESQKEIKS